MATLKDVARATGLGLATVSRALNGHPKVHAATRARVEQAAKELGYQPNALARSLRSNSSKVIGLIIPDLENNFYTSGAAEIQEVLAAEGYRLIVCCSGNDPAVDAALLKSLVERRVDGIVHVPCTAAGSDIIRASNPNLPVVEYARRSSSTLVDSVVGDEALGAQLLTEHLLSLGHRNIAMIAGSEDQSTTVARVAGFATAVRLADIDPKDCPVLYGSYDPAWGQQATSTIINEMPEVTAIFASSSRTVLGVFRSLNSYGLSVPADISMVGFLNPSWFEVAAAPMTTYELPLKDMGAMVADLLVKRIRSVEAKEPSALPRTVRLEGRMILRNSTSTPRIQRLEPAV
jgi:LacI family transcriptional regulator